MHLAVVGCSMNPRSRSFALAELAAEELTAMGHEAPLYDLREHTLPFSGSAESRGHPQVAEFHARFEQAQGILLATPIYCYGSNSAAKNLIELTGNAWQDKPVGFLCSAGGSRSYMSIMGLAESLMLDFRCLIVPRFVYATKSDFALVEGQPIRLESEAIRERVTELAMALARLARGLALADAT
jgi:FMN reductase